MWNYLIQTIQTGFHSELLHNAGLYRYFCSAKNTRHLRLFSSLVRDGGLLNREKKNLNLYQISNPHIFVYWVFIILSDLVSNLFFKLWRLLFAINQSLNQNCFNIHLYPHISLSPPIYHLLIVSNFIHKKIICIF